MKGFMIENTIENKRRFFSMYGIGINSSSPIQLKYIGMISNEDAIRVAKLMKVKDNDFFVNQFEINEKDLEMSYIKRGREYVSYLFRENNVFSSKMWYDLEYDFINVIDYLRLKMYAIPWMGLSVDTLIAWKWIEMND